MNCKNYLLIFFISLTSCAGNPWESSQVSEVFDTEITSSGLKIFNYSLTRVTGQNGDTEAGGGKGKGKGKGKGSGKHGGGGKNGSGGMGKGKSVDVSATKLYFNKKLESKLKETGYCQDGYIELNSSLGRRLLKMRGECEEGATEEDRIKFANNEKIIY